MHGSGSKRGFSEILFCCQYCVAVAYAAVHIGQLLCISFSVFFLPVPCDGRPRGDL